MNVSCTTSECPVLLNSSCVFYEGSNLAATGITTNDTVETVIQKLNTAIAAAGTGTVTSFSSGDLSPLFTTSVTTATTTPALSFTLSNQVANRVFAGPASGGAASPTFRALVAADIPTTNGISAIGTSIGLGGTLAVDTLIEINPNLDLFVGDSGTGYGLIVSTNTGVVGISNFHGGIFVDGTGSLRVADGRISPDIKGLEYASDTYGADFSTASLIHKGYADSTYITQAFGDANYADIDILQFVEGEITSAEILNAFTSPVELIPSPGAGNIILPVSILLFYDYNSVAYATNTTILLKWGATTFDYTIFSILDQTTDKFQMLPTTSGASSMDIRNVNFNFSVQTGNPTAGNSPIYYKILYKIVSAI